MKMYKYKGMLARIDDSVDRAGANPPTRADLTVVEHMSRTKPRSGPSALARGSLTVCGTKVTMSSGGFVHSVIDCFS